MKDFNTAEKKLELIFAKYELISYSTQKFMETYNSEELYDGLLSRLETIRVLDSDFILLGDNMEKYREIIQQGRVRYHTKGKIRNHENDMLVALNGKEPTKKKDKEKYLESQLKLRLPRDNANAFLRKREWYREKAILELSEFDYTYLNFIELMKKGLKITTREAPIKYVSTIHYLLNNAQEIFMQDPLNIDATLSLIDAFEEQSLFPKGSGMRKVKKQLNSMNKKR